MSDSESIPHYKAHPMPVSSFIKLDTPNEGDELHLVLQVGAYYYAETKERTYEIVRLLEHRADSIHFQVIGVVDRIPMLEGVIALRPMMLHIPLPVTYLLSVHLIYIGATPLTDEDLEGYKLYLDRLDFYRARAESMISDLIWQSKKKSLAPVHIKYHNGEVEFN